jgi:DNA invertase Pin-like site-specific DNA recombinase
MFGDVDMRCSLYSRVSTDYQTTENQLSVLREVAKNANRKAQNFSNEVIFNKFKEIFSE